MIGKKIDNPLSMYARFAGLNKLHYWMWGFENSVKPVMAFVGAFSVPPVVGTVYTDNAVAVGEYTYLRAESAKAADGSTNVTLYIFSVDHANTTGPVLQAGIATGPLATGHIDFTAHSTIMYEHLYELDAFGRQLRDYRTAEQAVTDEEGVVLYAAGDKKNLTATGAKRMTEYDIRYRNMLCKSFNFKCASPDLASWETNYLGFDEARGDYDSDTWTLPTDLKTNTTVPAHYQLQFQVGRLESSLVALGVTDISVEVGIALQSLQDTVSGLYIAEPIFEDKYDIKVSGTISRHSSETYQGYRDNQDRLVARVGMNYGYYMQEILVNAATLSDAGPNDDNVAREVLALDVEDTGANAWAVHLTGNTLIHKSPIVFRVRDFDPINQMFAN
jgi:hypothetical protein